MESDAVKSRGGCGFLFFVVVSCCLCGFLRATTIHCVNSGCVFRAARAHVYRAGVGVCMRGVVATARVPSAVLARVGRPH